MLSSFLLTSILTVVAAGPLRSQDMVCPEYQQGDLAVFFPNPDDCGSYYMCDAGGVPQLMNCPSNLSWNPELNVCDWPENVDCQASGDGGNGGGDGGDGGDGGNGGGDGGDGEGSEESGESSESESCE